MLAPPMAAASSMWDTAFFSMRSIRRCRRAFPWHDRQTVFQSPSLPPYRWKFFSFSVLTCWQTMHCRSLLAAIMRHLSNCMIDRIMGAEATPPPSLAAFNFSWMPFRYMASMAMSAGMGSSMKP